MPIPPDASTFSLPPGLNPLDALDVALPQFERWIDQVLACEGRDDPGIFETLASQSLSDKIDRLFPGGYPHDEKCYDRYIWPLIKQLVLLRAHLTRDTAIWAAAEWMTAAGFLDDEPDLMPDPTRKRDGAWQIRIDALFMTVVQGIGLYVQGWTCEAVEIANPNISA